MIRKQATAVLLAGLTLAGFTLSGCGNKVNENAVFATLDDTEISMGIANFYAKYQQATYDQYYMSYFGEDMWNTDLYGSGSTMQEDVKSSVVDQLEESYLLQAHMGDYSISLSEDETKAIDTAAEAFMTDNTPTALEQIGATDVEVVKEMLTLQTIRAKMQARIKEDADATVTDEEAAQRTFSYVELSIAGTYDADSNYVEYTEEQIADLKIKATEISESTDFDTAVTDAGYTVSTASYGSAEDEDNSLDTLVLEAADQLSEQEVSSVVETDSALYVLRLDKELDEDATATKKEEMITEKQDAYYTQILDEFKENITWTLNEKEWEKVTFKDLFTSYTSTEEGSETQLVEDSETGIETEAVVETETAQ